MHSKDSNDVSRRRALTVLGAASITSLAGCSGDGGGTDTEAGGETAESEGTNGTNAGSGTTGTPRASISEPASITLWTNIHGQSQVAEEFMQTQINRFKERTNNKVNWVKEPVTNVQNGNWLQRMENQQGPTLYQTAFSRMGSFVANNHVTPWGDVFDQLDDSVVSGTEWAHDTVRNVFRGFEGEKLKMMPLGFVMQEPFVARRDHFEEAELSIEDDFPPTNPEELIDIATTLKENGPADIGFQVHGSPGDLMDEISPTWAHGRGGEQGLYVNEAWDDTLLDSDAWKWSLRKQVEIYQDLGLSAENSAQTSDEDAVRLVIDGDASMSQVGMLNYGLFANQAPELLENGTLQFAPSWEGESGYRGEFNMNGIAIRSKPSNMDSETWQGKLNAAVNFVNQLATVEVQQEVFDNWGLLPFNQTAWEQISTRESGIFEAATTIAEGSEFGWQAHPDMADIQYNIPGPIFQRAMNGQISAEEACNQAAKRIRQQVFQ